MEMEIQNIKKEKLIQNLSLRKVFLFKVFLGCESFPLLLLRFPSESYLKRMSYERLVRWERRMSRLEDL